MPEATPLTVETLLRHEPFVRAVVRGVLADDAQVQDVLQETWMRALRRSPREGTHLRPWLARVARHLALDLRRSGQRRRAREQRCAKEEAVESVETSHARLSAQREVVDAVLALDEPYRSVVLLRYYQGLSAAEIARRLGRVAGTVRSQLHRAHAELRSKLDARFDGGRSAWSALLLPTLRDGAKPLAGASVASGKVVALALGAAAIAGTVLLLRPERDVPAGRHPLAAAAAALEGDDGVADAGLAMDVPAPRGGEATASAEDGSAEWIVALDDQEPGKPGDAATTDAVAASARNEAESSEPPAVRARLWFAGQPQRGRGFSLSHSPRSRSAPAPRGSAAVPEGASVAAHHRDGRVETDADGYLVVRCPSTADVLTEHSLRLVRERTSSEGATVRGELDVPLERWSGVLDLGDVYLEADPLAAEGRVVRSDGHPVRRAFVELVPADGSKRSLTPTLDVATSDADGRFQLFHDLAADRLVRVRARGPSHEREESEPFSPGRRDVLVVLDPAAGRTVRGRILLDPDLDTSDLLVYLRASRTRHAARLDDEGGFTIANVEPGHLRLELAQDLGVLLPRPAPGEPGWSPVLPAEPPPVHVEDLGEVTGEGTIELPTSDLRGLVGRTTVRCVDPAGRPVPNARLHPVPDGPHTPPVGALAHRARGARSGTGWDSWWTLDETGEVGVLFAASASVPFDVSAAGHRDARMALGLGRGAVVLEPTIDVRVVAPLAEGLEEKVVAMLGTETPGEWWLEASLAPTAGGTLPFGRVGEPFDEAGEATLEMQTEGEHELTLFLGYRLDSSSYRWFLAAPEGEPVVIDLRPGPLRELTAPHGEAELSDALERLVAEVSDLPALPAPHGDRVR